MINYKIFVSSFVAIFITVACSSVKNDFQPDAGCPPPLFELGYPYKVLKDSANEPTLMPLSEIWKPQLSEEERTSPEFHRVYSIVARNDDEIWTVDQENLIRYTPTTHEIKYYTIENNLGSVILPDVLFVSTDSTLWALGSRYVSGEAVTGLHLSRLNDESDQFEIIADRDDIFSQSVGRGLYDQIVEDQDGILWMIYGKSLFRYDPNMNQAKLVVGEQQGINLQHSLVIAPDGELWFTGLLANAINDKNRVARLHIFRYDPLTEETRDYFTLPNLQYSRLSQLFFDHLGRLWVDDYGWLEIPEEGNGQWHEIIRSPIFISYLPESDFSYAWVHPSPKLETADNQIWFPFGIGLAKLDLKTNQWCLLSTLPIFDIAQDNNNTLWVAAEGQIYKYDPEN